MQSQARVDNFLSSSIQRLFQALLTCLFSTAAFALSLFVSLLDGTYSIFVDLFLVSDIASGLQLLAGSSSCCHSLSFLLGIEGFKFTVVLSRNVTVNLCTTQRVGDYNIYQLSSEV